MDEFFKMYNNSSAAGTSGEDTEGDSIGPMRGWQQHDIVEIGTGWVIWVGKGRGKGGDYHRLTPQDTVPLPKMILTLQMEEFFCKAPPPCCFKKWYKFSGFLS